MRRLLWLVGENPELPFFAVAAALIVLAVVSLFTGWTT